MEAFHEPGLAEYNLCLGRQASSGAQKASDKNGKDGQAGRHPEKARGSGASGAKQARSDAHRPGVLMGLCDAHNSREHSW